MLKKVLKPADILLIVPPFMLPDSQSLAVHILQACAKQAGFSVQVFYANIHFASYMGDDYEKLCLMNPDLIGERIFFRAAYGKTKDSPINENIYKMESVYGKKKAKEIQISMSFFGSYEKLDLERLKIVEEKAISWTKIVSKEIADLSYKIIGCTSSYEQTNASFALLKGVKSLKSHITTILGGYNCEDECALGMASIDPEGKVIDHIFSGECETAFVEFLKDKTGNKKEINRFIKGEPNFNLDSLPMVDYSDYFKQLNQMLPSYKDNNKISLSYETSRGCWWGQKKQCLFCGYSDRMKFRQKSESKILDEIKQLEKYNIKYIDMADLAMPQNHFDALIPKLENKNWIIYFEQRASLNYKKLKSLKKSGITHIQPGLETLSDSILKSVHKGNTVLSNISFLRNATSLDLNVYWNFLWGIPGEETKEYKKILKLVPLLMHMKPPLAMFHMGIVKFSPFFNHSKHFNITKKYPLLSYKEVFPEHTDIDNIALYYIGEYETETYKNPSIIQELNNLLEHWNSLWNVSLTRPRLEIHKKSNNKFILIDTRNIPGLQNEHVFNKKTASMLINNSKFNNTKIQNWAVEQNLALVYENKFLSLITGKPELLEELEVK